MTPNAQSLSEEVSPVPSHNIRNKRPSTVKAVAVRDPACRSVLVLECFQLLTTTVSAGSWNPGTQRDPPSPLRRLRLHTGFVAHMLHGREALEKLSDLHICPHGRKPHHLGADGIATSTEKDHWDIALTLLWFNTAAFGDCLTCCSSCRSSVGTCHVSVGLFRPPHVGASFCSGDNWYSLCFKQDRNMSIAVTQFLVRASADCVSVGAQRKVALSLDKH